MAHRRVSLVQHLQSSFQTTWCSLQSLLRLDFILDWGITLVFTVDAWLRYRELRHSTSPNQLREPLDLVVTLSLLFHGPSSLGYLYSIWYSSLEVIRVPEILRERPKLPAILNIPRNCFPLYTGLYCGFTGWPVDGCILRWRMITSQLYTGQ